MADHFASDRERKALSRKKGAYESKKNELAKKSYKDIKDVYPKGSFDHILKKRSTGNVG